MVVGVFNWTDIINGPLSLILEFLAWATDVLLVLLGAVIGMGDVVNDPAIINVWRIMVDLANTGFVIVLLFIAVANIVNFQIGNFNVRQILPKFIFAVVAVNFSRLFCAVILDFANVLEAGLYQLIAGLGPHGSAIALNADGVPMTLGYKLKMAASADALIPAAKAAAGVSATGVAVIINSITLLIAFLFLTFGLASLVLIFAGRVIYLWVLITLSPFFFLAMVAPFLQAKSTKWWQEFSKYAFMHVQLAFYLSLAVAVTQNFMGGAGKVEATWDTVGMAVQPGAFSLQNLFALIFVVVLIFYAVMKAISAEGYGIAGEWAGKLRGYGARAPWAVGKFAAKPITGVATTIGAAGKAAAMKRLAASKGKMREWSAEEGVEGEGITKAGLRAIKKLIALPVSLPDRARSIKERSAMETKRAKESIAALPAKEQARINVLKADHAAEDADGAMKQARETAKNYRAEVKVILKQAGADNISKLSGKNKERAAALTVKALAAENQARLTRDKARKEMLDVFSQGDKEREIINQANLLQSLNNGELVGGKLSDEQRLVIDDLMSSFRNIDPSKLTGPSQEKFRDALARTMMMSQAAGESGVEQELSSIFGKMGKGKFSIGNISAIRMANAAAKLDPTEAADLNSYDSIFEDLHGNQWRTKFGELGLKPGETITEEHMANRVKLLSGGFDAAETFYNQQNLGTMQENMTGEDIRDSVNNGYIDFQNLKNLANSSKRELNKFSGKQSNLAEEAIKDLLKDIGVDSATLRSDQDFAKVFKDKAPEIKAALYQRNINAMKTDMSGAGASDTRKEALNNQIDRTQTKLDDLMKTAKAAADQAAADKKTADQAEADKKAAADQAEADKKAAADQAAADQAAAAQAAADQAAAEARAKAERAPITRGRGPAGTTPPGL